LKKIVNIALKSERSLVSTTICFFFEQTKMNYINTDNAITLAKDTKECQDETKGFSQCPDIVKGSTTINASQIQR